MTIAHSEQGGALKEEGGWVAQWRASSLQSSLGETEGGEKSMRAKKECLSCKVSTFTARSDFYQD